eukprot:g1043.t1
MFHVGQSVALSYGHAFREDRPDEPFEFEGVIVKIEESDVFIDFGDEGVFRFESQSRSENILLDVDGYEVHVDTGEDMNNMFSNSNNLNLNLMEVPSISVSHIDTSAQALNAPKLRYDGMGGDRVPSSRSPVTAFEVGTGVSVLYSEEFQEEFPGEPYDYTGYVKEVDGNVLVIDFGKDGEFTYHRVGRKFYDPEDFEIRITPLPSGSTLSRSLSRSRENERHQQHTPIPNSSPVQNSPRIRTSSEETQTSNSNSPSSFVHERPTSQAGPNAKPNVGRREVFVPSYNVGERHQRNVANDTASAAASSPISLQAALDAAAVMGIPNWSTHLELFEEGKWKGKKALLMAVHARYDYLGLESEPFTKAAVALSYHISKKFTEGNFNVMAAALDLFTRCVLGSPGSKEKPARIELPQFPRGSAFLVFPLVMKKSGDRRLGDSVKKLILAIAECCGVRWTLRTMITVCSKKNFKDPKSLARALEIISVAAHHFGPSSIDLRSTMAYILGENGVAHDKGRVVNGQAIQTVEKLCQLFGSKVETVAAQLGMNDKIRKQLDKAFREGRKVGNENSVERVESKLLNSVGGNNGKNSFNSDFNGENKEQQETTKKSAWSIGRGEQKLNSNVVHENLEEKMKRDTANAAVLAYDENVPRMDISPFLTDEVQQLLADFQKKDSWKLRKRGLEIVQDLIVQKAKRRIILNSSSEKLIKILKDRATEKNATLKIFALQIIADLGQAISFHHVRRKEMLRLIAPAAIAVFADKKKSVLLSGISALDRWIVNENNEPTGIAPVIPSICSALTEKPSLRVELLAWLQNHLNKATKSNLMVDSRLSKLLVKPLVVCLEDRKKSVQKLAAGVLVEVMRSDPMTRHLLDSAVSKLNIASQRSIAQIREKIDAIVQSGGSSPAFASAKKDESRSRRWVTKRNKNKTVAQIAGNVRAFTNAPPASAPVGAVRMLRAQVASRTPAVLPEATVESVESASVMSRDAAIEMIGTMGIEEWDTTHVAAIQEGKWIGKKQALLAVEQRYETMAMEDDIEFDHSSFFDAVFSFAYHESSKAEHRNHNVILAMLRCMSTLLKHSRKQFSKGHSQLLFRPLVPRLGEKKLMSQLFNLFIDISHLSGVPFVFGQILQIMKNVTAPPVLVSVLVFFEKLISSSGIRSFDLPSLTRYASGAKGMESNAKGVETAAISTLEAMYKQIGPKLVDLLQAVRASEIKIKKLENSFEKCGYDINAAAANASAIPTDLDAILANVRNNSGKTFEGERSGVQEEGGEGELLESRNDISALITTDLLDLLRDQTRKDSWIQRKEGLDRVEHIINVRASRRVAMNSATEKLLRVLVERAAEKNMALKIQALKLLAMLGSSIDSSQWSKWCPLVSPPMIDALADSKAGTRRAALEALEGWTVPLDGPYQGRSYGFAPLLTKVKGPLESKPTVRPSLLAWLLKHLPTAASAGIVDGSRITKRLVSPLVKCMQDKKTVVQKQAASVLVEVLKCDPVGARFALQGAVSKLSAAAQRSLEAEGGLLQWIYEKAGGKEVGDNITSYPPRNRTKSLLAQRKIGTAPLGKGRRDSRNRMRVNDNGTGLDEASFGGKNILAKALTGNFIGEYAEAADGSGSREDISQKLTSVLISQLKDQSNRESWTNRKAAMDTLETILTDAHAAGGIVLTRKVGSILRILQERCGEKNMQLRVKALQLTAGFGRCIDVTKRKKVVGICTSALCDALADMKSLVQDAANDALDAWCVDGEGKPVCLGQIIPFLAEPLRVKPALRGELLKWLQSWLPMALRNDLLNTTRVCKILIKPLVQCMVDRKRSINKLAASLAVYIIRAQPVVGRMSLAAATSSMKSAVLRQLEPLLKQILEHASDESGDGEVDISSFDTPPIAIRKRIPPSSSSGGVVSSLNRVSRVRRRFIDARETANSYNGAAAASAARRGSPRALVSKSNQMSPRRNRNTSKTRSAAASAAHRRNSPRRGNSSPRRTTFQSLAKYFTDEKNIESEMGKPSDGSDISDMLAAKAEISRYRLMLKQSLRQSFSVDNLPETED